MTTFVNQWFDETMVIDKSLGISGSQNLDWDITEVMAAWPITLC